MNSARIALIVSGIAGAGVVATLIAAPATVSAGAFDSSTSATEAVNPPALEGLDIAAAAATERREPVVEQVYEIGKKHPGLAIVAVDGAALAVTVRWKGKVPAELVELASTDHDGVTVEVLSADYSQAEIDAAAEAALDALGPARAYGAGGTLDRSGLVIDVPPAEAKAAAASTLEADVQEKLATEDPALADMPITLQESGPITGLGRFNSAAPRKGGAWMERNDGTGSCSTGFSVVNSAGVGKLLSAAHCDPLGNHRWNDGGGDIIASASNVTYHHGDIDSLLMDPEGGTIGRVYAGGWGTSSLLDVAKSGATAVGDQLCTGGAMSGDHCSGEVVQRNYMYHCPGRTTLWCTGDILEGKTYGVAAHGDSGGPVYYYRPSDGRVGARGLISASKGTTTKSCSTRNGPGQCHTQMLFPEIADVLDYWNVKIETHG